MLISIHISSMSLPPKCPRASQRSTIAKHLELLPIRPPLPLAVALLSLFSTKPAGRALTSSFSLSCIKSLHRDLDLPSSPTRCCRGTIEAHDGLDPRSALKSFARAIVPWAYHRIDCHCLLRCCAVTPFPPLPTDHSSTMSTKTSPPASTAAPTAKAAPAVAPKTTPPKSSGSAASREAANKMHRRSRSGKLDPAAPMRPKP